jgi:hypothetical protein
LGQDLSVIFKRAYGADQVDLQSIDEIPLHIVVPR